jgi:SAM-dependent methyltransferase
MAGPPGEGVRRRAVEVGAGTGKATVDVATRGLEVTAVEPDEGMAAVLRRHIAGLGAVRVVPSGFEAFDPGLGGFDLVYSGQAWHWVDPVQRWTKAAETLRPGGGLALFWHRTRWADGDPVRAELDDIYRRVAPELRAREPGFPGNAVSKPDRGIGHLAEEADSSGQFTDAGLTTFAWPARYDAASYTALLQTQSDHRMADPAVVRRLVEAVADLVEHHGGAIDVPYVTELFTARRVGT